MKKTVCLLKAIIHRLPYAVLLIILVACNGNTTDKSKRHTLSQYPAGLIGDNLREASHALHVLVNKITLDETKSLRTDRGRIGYAALIFHCKVVDSYKGDLTKEASVSFLAFWEYHKGLVEEQQKENKNRIVFLNKSVNGSFHALSYGVFVFTEDLDRALKKGVETPS